MTGRLSLQHTGPYVIVILIGVLLFIPFLGRVHLFDWDEINFAESAREMLVTGNFSRVMIDYKPFWEKPPLFFWMQALSMKVFGISEFAARFPNAVCGIVTLCFIFYLGRKYFDNSFAWLWVLAYIGSFLPHFYFKSGIIDPWFNLFIISGIIFLMQALRQQGNHLKYFAFAGLLTGLAILTKGPVSLLVVVLTGGIAALAGARRPPAIGSVLVFFTAMMVTASLWFGWEVVQNGWWFIAEFVRYQSELFSVGVAGHSGPVYYHVVVLLAGCFPASVFALNSVFSKHLSDSEQQRFRKWMLCLFFVVLLLFSIVKTKIIHYSSLCYLPLTFLAAWEIYFKVKSGAGVSKIVAILLITVGVLVGTLAALIPYLANTPERIIQYVKDPFAKANLEAVVDWPMPLMLIGLLFTLFSAGSFFLITKKLKHGSMLFFAATCIFIQAVLFAFVPRIERYTQGAAIDFYKTLRGEDVYIEVLGFKSYAHLFYSQKKPQKNSNSGDKKWLLTGEIDKPAYFVCKINKTQEYKAMPQLKEIERKNGFVFFKREPPP